MILSPPMTLKPNLAIGNAATEFNPANSPEPLAKKIWKVVKPVILTAAILTGIASAVGLAFGVTLGLSKALLHTAIAVGGVAFLYAFFKFVEGEELSSFQKKYPDISKQIENIYENSGLDAVKTYVKLHQTKLLLDSEVEKRTKDSNKNKFFIEMVDKVFAQLNAETKKYELNPSYKGLDSNSLEIANKHIRILKAVNHIKQAKGIDKKVQDYFQKTLEKLQQGVNVPLPDYYHATKTSNGAKGIIGKKLIIQSTGGHSGPGVYISTNNEGHYGYGPYTFAIDQAILKNTSAKYFIGRTAIPPLDIYDSLWIAVLKNIPVAENTIAFIDTSDAKQIPFLKGQLSASKLNIEVIERTTSDAIRKVFDATTEIRETPSKKWHGYSHLPANMRLCTS